MNMRDLMAKRAALIGQARALVDGADQETRVLNDVEEEQYRAWMAEIEGLGVDIERREGLERLEQRMQQTTLPAPAPLDDNTHQAQTLRDEVRAIASFVRTGNPGLLHELRASNATDMNITTSADGGYAVPTGHYNGIVAKRNESSLVGPLGCLRIPGVGTTVNVPYDNGTANQFVSTAETVGFDLDAPALNVAAMTLVKYTKKVTLSDELLQDEDSNLVAFLNDYVGRAAGLTYNTLLFTEVLANGTSVTLASASAISAGDPETLGYTLKGEYGDNAAFVMRRATEGKFRALTGSPFLYQTTPAGTGRTLAGFPIYNSEAVAAIGAGNKSVAFGNFAYVGYREAPTMTFLRDPYSAAGTGQVNLFYYFRVVFKVLIAEAVLYGRHPTA